MRVTFSMNYQRTMQNLNRKQDESNRLSLTVASGLRMSAPKDDPLGWSQAMDIKQGLRELSAFDKNVDFATGWGQATSSALGQLHDLLTQARQMGISAVSVNSEAQTAALVSSLEKISEQAMAVANTRYDDMYVFSGRSFTTAPFDETTFDYLGDTEAFEVRVGRNNRQTINMDGQSVFLTDSADPATNILSTLAALKTAIETGDTDGIEAQTAAIEIAQEHVSSQSSVVGARMSSLETQGAYLADLQVNNRTDLSNVEDADIVDAIMQLQQKQTTLEAALKVTTMVDRLSLVNFL